MVEGDNWPHRDRTREVEQRSTRRSTASRPTRRRACPKGFEQAVGKMAKRVYRALELTGYARIDLRMDDDGRRLRPRGQPQPADRLRRGLRRVGRTQRHEIRRPARPDPGARAAVAAGTGGIDNCRLQIADCGFGLRSWMEVGRQWPRRLNSSMTRSCINTGATRRFVRCSARPSRRCSLGATRWSCCRPAAASRCASSCRALVIDRTPSTGNSAIPAIALVISPLIALMKDQVDGLVAQGVAAACLHSGQSAEQRRAALELLRAGTCRLLYVAPERAVGDTADGFRALMRDTRRRPTSPSTRRIASASGATTSGRSTGSWPDCATPSPASRCTPRPPPPRRACSATSASSCGWCSPSSTSGRSTART